MMHFDHDTQDILTFLQVLENHPTAFSTEALSQLPALDQTLAKLEEEPVKVVAKAIRDWCSNYPDIGNAAIAQSKEIEAPHPSNPAYQETILQNRFPAPEVREAIQKRLDASS